MSEVIPFSQSTLKALSVLTRFNDVIGNTNVLRALYHEGQKTWNKAMNADTQEHLIKDIHTTGFKTDSINLYVSVIVKIFMASQGANLSGWTKNSLEKENLFTMAAVSRMGAKLYSHHDELFSDVIVRLFGFDKTLVDYVIATDNDDKRVDLLVGYVASQFDDLLGLDNVEIYYDELIDHLKHVDLIKDRDELITRAIQMVASFGGPQDAYVALLKSAQTVIGYVIGDTEGKEDTVFTFGEAKY